MEISDTDIESMDECEVDTTIINAVRVNIRSQGRCLHSIKVKNRDAGYRLVNQLLVYQEELYEAKKISE